MTSLYILSILKETFFNLSIEINKLALSIRLVILVHSYVIMTTGIEYSGKATQLVLLKLSFHYLFIIKFHSSNAFKNISFFFELTIFSICVVFNTFYFHLIIALEAGFIIGVFNDISQRNGSQFCPIFKAYLTFLYLRLRLKYFCNFQSHKWHCKVFVIFKSNITIQFPVFNLFFNPVLHFISDFFW